MVVSHQSSSVFFITECKSCAQYCKWDLVGSVHQLTLSSLFSKRLHAIRPSFLMCMSGGSMTDCSSNFQSTPSNLPFLAKNSQICEEEYKIKVVD